MSDASSIDRAAADRYEREQQFHDARFGAEHARSADRFYVVNERCQQDYDDMVAATDPAAKVLEYGCGTGSAAFMLGEKGVDVLAIDISAVAVDIAAQIARDRGLDSLRFEVMNAEKLDVPDRSIDLVCGTGILHHLDLDLAADEIRRVLTDGGRALFIEPLGHNPLINLYRRLTPGMRTDDEHPLRRADLDRFGRGFEIVETRSYVLLSLLAVPFRRFSFLPRLVDTLSSLDRKLFDRFPRLADHAWTVLIELEHPVR